MSIPTILSIYGFNIERMFDNILLKLIAIIHDKYYWQIYCPSCEVVLLQFLPLIKLIFIPSVINKLWISDHNILPPD
jgi:hypothetical protein